MDVTAIGLVSLLGFAAGACTTAAFLPQVVRSWRTKSCRDLSPLMLAIFATGLILWFIFGIYIQEMPIILANGVTLGLVIVIIGLKYVYRSKGP